MSKRLRSMRWKKKGKQAPEILGFTMETPPAREPQPIPRSISFESHQNSSGHISEQGRRKLSCIMKGNTDEILKRDENLDGQFKQWTQPPLESIRVERSKDKWTEPVLRNRIEEARQKAEKNRNQESRIKIDESLTR